MQSQGIAVYGSRFGMAADSATRLPQRGYLLLELEVFTRPVVVAPLPGGSLALIERTSRLTTHLSAR